MSTGNFKPRRGVSLIVMVSAVVLINACQRTPDLADDGTAVLAQVGEATITAADFEAEMNRRAAMRPGYFDRAAHRRELLEDLIDHQAQINAARAAGIDQQPEFQALIERLMIQRLREARLASALAELEISDAELRDYYDAHPDQFGRPERRQVAMIRIDLPARMDAETREAQLARAAEAREMALSLPEEVVHFGAVAVNYSSDRGSRYQGGVVGWLVQHSEQGYNWPEEVLAAVSQLTPGEVSEIIETDAALWLLRLVAQEPARRQAFETVAEGIRHRLTRERAAALEAGLMADLRAGQLVVINESVLDAVPVPVFKPEDQPDPAPPRRPPAMPVVQLDDAEGQVSIENSHD